MNQLRVKLSMLKLWWSILTVSTIKIYQSFLCIILYLLLLPRLLYHQCVLPNIKYQYVLLIEQRYHPLQIMYVIPRVI